MTVLLTISKAVLISLKEQLKRCLKKSKMTLKMIKRNRQTALIIMLIAFTAIAIGILWGIKTERIFESVLMSLITSAFTALLLVYGTGKAPLFRRK